MYLRKVKLLRDEIKSYQTYPFSIPIVKNLKSIELTRNVTFFVGENGSGKSTLLEAIADKCEFNTAGGGRNNYYDVDAAQSDLGECIRLSWAPKTMNGFFLRAESFFQFASHIDHIDEDGYKQYGGKSLHEQSHGESFFSLFQHRFNKKAIYLLDEPEAALSPQRQLSFLRIIHDLTIKGDCQFIIATHSPILLGFPDAVILSFDNDEIKEVEYEETSPYAITKYFLQNRKRFLHEILKEG